MKNLVWGALLGAAASTTACTSNDSRITAHWSFSSYANRSQATDPCPSGFNTAEVHAKPWDAFAGEFAAGTEYTDLFDCSDKSGLTRPVANGTYLVWVAITDQSGNSVYAESESMFFDTFDGNFNIVLPTLFTDAGFMDLTWKLVDGSNRQLTCSQAGVGANGSVETIATAVGSTFMLTDKFTCEDGFGFTDPLPTGTYTVSVDAEDGTGAVGVAPAIPNKTITAPNGLTHLGRVVIPIQ